MEQLVDLRLLGDVVAVEQRQQVGEVEQLGSAAQAKRTGLGFNLPQRWPALDQGFTDMKSAKVLQQMRIQIQQRSAPIDLIQRRVLLRAQVVGNGKCRAFAISRPLTVPNRVDTVRRYHP